MSPTPGQVKAKALMDAGRDMDLVTFKTFTAVLIGVLQDKFSPDEFATAIEEAKVITYRGSCRKGRA